MKITNTAAQQRHLLDGLPGMIEASEARGQRELCKSAQLPKDMDKEARRVLAAAGVVFGEADPNDPLFLPATLPTGWQIKPTDHSMWSDLVDEKGRVRAVIFYKAAFYDRSARLGIRSRFSAQCDYTRLNGDRDPVWYVVKDGSQVVAEWAIDPAVPRDESNEYEGDSFRVSKLAAAWLDERYPQWRDAGAHWD